jgi:hypothetical protein
MEKERMKAIRNLFLLTVCLLFVLPFAASQTATSALTPVAATAATSVPALVPFSGTVAQHEGRAASEVSLTFLIFKDQTGGEPVFVETQTVAVDAAGRYSVHLGATLPSGLPAEVFSSGESRWLEIQQAGEQAQPRILLASVPYAMKAADAATLGGLPASAFVLAAAGASNDGSANSSVSAVTPAVAGTGTTDYLPLWTNSTGSLGNSALFQSGSGSTAKVGINLTNPVSALDVNGSVIARGNLVLPATGAATATSGKNSQPLSLTASSFDSAVGTAVSENFRWQAEPTGNNTASPSGTLNLLYSSGSSALTETGLKIANSGQITFAAGQTFPGSGTVKSVALTAPSSDFTVSGSPVSGSGTLALNWTTAPTNVATANAIVKRDYQGGFSAGQIIAGNIVISTLGNQALFASGGTYGVYGTGGTGVYGYGAIGVSGAGGTYGVYGTVPSSGVDGVHGETASENSGVAGINTNSSAGYGVYGQAVAGYGVYGQAGGLSGVGGGFFSTSFGDALYAHNATGFAADFSGNVAVVGSLSKSGGSFKIDHPLDPANKYLYHSFVESPDMMNIYNGNVTTDAQGRAVVQLPEWFETLNRDFRYQLTVIGQFSQAIVASEVANHQFTIQTEKPNVKVSWQVTGIRQDAWANAHRIPVEESKPEAERGFYLHPELFGAAAEKSIAVARHPMLLKQMKEAALKQKASTK